jgi:hypothetical protein
MADWVTISALATAGGTLVLAGTTYASVRSANRAARVAELSLLAGLRPLLVPSSDEDAPVRVGFADSVSVTAPGGGIGVEVIDGRLYLAITLRNVGPGLGVLYGGYVHDHRAGAREDHPPLDEFRRLLLDLYVPPGKIGYWQIAFREDDERREELLVALERGQFSIDLLYGDYEGGQRVVSRYGVFQDDGQRRLRVVRHWQVDRANPR